MMALTLVLAVVLIINGVQSAPQGWFHSTLAALNASENHQLRLDQKFDDHIEEIRDALLEYDVYGLMDLEQNPLFLPYRITLTQGWLQNVALIKRAGKMTLGYRDKVLKADFNVGWDDLAFDYKYTLTALIPIRTGNFHGQVYDPKVNIKCTIDLNNYFINITNIDFYETTKVDIKLEGHYVDRVLNYFMRAFTWAGRDLILYEAQRIFLEMLKCNVGELNEQLGAGHRHFTLVDQVKTKFSFPGFSFHVREREKCPKQSFKRRY